MPTKIIGNAPYQVPRNADLGNMAYQDNSAVKVDGGSITLPADINQGYFQDTNISEVNPSLFLDFSNSKSLDPRITFTRASTATYYDGKTFAKSEENLITYSQDFDNTSGWLRVDSSISSNYGIAPDGTTTADLIVESPTLNEHLIYQTKSLAFDTVFSIYAKSANRNIILRRDNTPIWATFDLTNGVVSQQPAAGSASIVSVGNGWYRCILICPSTSYGNIVVKLWNSTSMSIANSTYTGDGVSGVYIWGAQLEQRTSVSYYTPTTTAQITNYIPVLQTAISNNARFDYDPVTGESKGLLIEEQRTNLLTYSDQFDNSAWNKAYTKVVSNSAIAPDGTFTADLIQEGNATIGYQNWYQTISQSATSYAFSVYVKKGSSDRFVMFGGSPQALLWVDMTTWTVFGSSNLVSYSIVPVGNGWYKCTLVYTNTSSGSFQNGANLVKLGTAQTVTYTGNGQDGMFMWGAQLEAGSFSTSYIPTVASQVTRSADSAIMTGINFSSWYRADEGTLYTEAIQETNRNGSSSYRHCVMIGDAGTTNYVNILIDGSNRLLSQVSYNSTGQAAMYSGVFNTGTAFKACTSYKANDFAFNSNSSDTTKDLSGYVQTNVDRMTIGYSISGATLSYLNGTIKKIAYYPKRLSDSEIQEMTL